jgi:hypothetical protein
LASLAIEVVFPDPFTPAIITTVGPAGAYFRPSDGPLSSSRSWALTNSSTSPVISLSRNACRTRSTITAVAWVPTSAR